MSDDDQQRLTAATRRRLLAGFASASAVSLAGCTDSGGSDGTATSGDADDSEMTSTGTAESMRGGTLNLAQAKSPVEFDPIVLNDVPSAEIASQVFEALYTYDEATGIVPQLASSEPTVEADGTEYVISINENATFSNGDPVTAEDVKYSFEAPVDEETENAAEVSQIEGVTVEDETTVRFVLAFPFGPFRHTLASRSIVPKSVRENDKEGFRFNPVGSGPFVFDEFQEGQLTRITRNEDYWGEPTANLDAVEFSPVEEQTTRVTTLQNGENDVIKTLPPQLYNTVEQSENATVQDVPSVSYFYLAMNCKEGPTTSATVRQAVDHVIDMDATIENFIEPSGVRQYSPVPQSVAETWDFPTDQWADIPAERDIERAQELFNEAGVPSDYEWTIIVPPDDKREQIGTSVGNGLQEAGFDNVTVQRLDWGPFLDRYVTGSESDYNIYALGWAGLPDPNSFCYNLFGRTEETLGVTNGSFYGANSQNGTEAAEKFAQARELADMEERRQLYIDGITAALEDRAHLPAYSLNSTYGVRNRVNDFLAHPVEEFQLVTNHNNVSIQ